MRTWSDVPLPELPGSSQPARIVESTGSTIVPDGRARLYVCGITPYDATHLGHAFTYTCFDMLQRQWRDAGLEVTYAQNVTDIDDPLFERAAATGQDHRELAAEQIDLFRSDMEHLRVLPPDHWTAVSEVLDDLEADVRKLSLGPAYELNQAGRTDYFLPTSPADVAGPRYRDIDLEQALRETGEDPDLPGKSGRLDQLIWRGAKGEDFRAEGEAPGAWRPGWHIECARIALNGLGPIIDVQGGGADLVFPHHCLSNVAMTALEPAAEVRGQMHTGLVAYRGEKMSKSLGNLELVSRLVNKGNDPMLIRLLLIAHRWDEDWEYTEADLQVAERRLTRWRRMRHTGGAGAADLLDEVRDCLADNLDTPRALAAIDAHVKDNENRDDRAGAQLFADMCDALLGIAL
ncbi:MAG: hypothetical protein Q4P33_01955 [Flaviflexus sp.]|nr:hypothetical protein [Flaviflexus sp.]